MSSSPPLVRVTRLCALVAAFLAVCGCAVNPQVVNMVPDGALYYRTHTSTVTIGAVRGGEESDPMFKGSRISSRDLRAALEEAFRRAGYFPGPAQGGGRDYYMTADILSQTQPAAGFDMTATLRVRYILTCTGDPAFCWSQDVSSSHTATVGDAFVGAERLNKANEGAVRNNLGELLKRLASLDI